MTLLAFAAERRAAATVLLVSARQLPHPVPTPSVSNAPSSTQRWTLPHGTQQQTRRLAHNRRQYNVSRPTVAPAGCAVAPADDAARWTRTRAISAISTERLPHPIL